ncbi:hypothetical protein EI427_23445 [Flammeovirga pectinis]|uniref:Outer membrane protein beta-barrel domain-containing protein n=1 Tax=Flammeovirga pectinis TaxID=2494373 RepID=A0A3Q9FSV1_9BACT|nr:hypothetical protein [Flammeovirga pectinis]AZQ65171.1 hypothetical protein EI427_23445 [Flammeovirga pectinis]
MKLTLNIILLLSLLSSQRLFAQQIDKIGKENPVKVTGGISVNQTAYSAWGMESRRDPYRYILSGNLNFDVYGMAIPLSFSYSNQNFSYNQPFNQFSLAPTYKWMNFQVGYGSISLSPYTLGGHTFFGGSVSGSPSDRWDFTVMYGRLKKAVATSNEGGESPSFRRMGVGFKTDYRHKSGSLGISFFHAKDNPSTYPTDSLPEGLLPEENLATSFTIGQQIIENLTIQTEIGISFLTTDTQSEKSPDRPQGLDWIFTSRTSTAMYWAVNGGINYTIKGWNIGGSYERIGPEYRTLGSYYANSDLETATLNIAGGLFQNKINLGANLGTQRDNLTGANSSDMSNFNMAFNLAWNVNEKINVNSSYSNFRSFTVIRDQFEVINEADPNQPLDTLNYTQLTDAANIGINWRISQSKNIAQSISLNVNYQQTADLQTDSAAVNADSKFWNGALGWNWSHKPMDLRFGISANASLTQANAAMPSTFTTGPTLSITKGFLKKKIKARSSFSINQSRTDQIIQSMVYSWRLGASTTLNKVHTFNLSSVLLNRLDQQKADNSISELTVSLAYSFRFNGLKKTKSKETN